MTFSEKLTGLRRKSGMSQEQLADRLGVTRQSVSKWEGGTAMPELVKLISLSELFGVSVDYLVKDWMEEPDNPCGGSGEISSKQADRLEKKVDELTNYVKGRVYRYDSKTRIFGLPLVSIRFGFVRNGKLSMDNTAKGIIAIGNGGLWGNGIFMESGQFRYVPEVYNDFIFTYIGEAVGFIGSVAVLVALAFLCIKILCNGLRAADDMGKYICVGVFGMIAVQIIINIGMCLGLLPVIGVTLPFLSAGGTSTGTLYLAIGVVLSVYMHSGKDMLFA